MPNIDYALEQEQILAGLPTAQAFDILIRQPLYSETLKTNVNARVAGDFTISGKVGFAIEKIDIFLITTTDQPILLTTIARSNFGDIISTEPDRKDQVRTFSFLVKFNGDSTTSIKYSALTNNTNYRIRFKGYDSVNAVRFDKIYENFVFTNKADTTTVAEVVEPYYSYKYNKLPLYNGTSNETHSLALNNHYSAKSVYNGYFRDYEKFLSSSNAQEKSLVNFQAYVNYKTYTSNNLKTCNLFVTRSLEINSTTKQIATDFNNYQELTKSFVSETREYMKNIIISNDMMKELSNYSEDEKVIFPFYNEITIKQLEKSSFNFYLKQYDLENEFLIFLYETTKNNGTGDEQFKVNNQIPIIQSYTSSLRGDGVTDTYVVDINNFLNAGINGFYQKKYINYNFTGSGVSGIGSRTNFPYLFLTKDNFYNKTDIKKKNKLIYSIFLPTLNSKTANAPNIDVGETVAFQIEKFSDEAQTNKISNIFFLNNMDFEEHVFTDTQVKYNTRYYYNIWAFRLVSFIKDGQRKTILVKNPIATRIVSKVIDSAPLPPSFNVVLNRNKKNSLLFLCETLIGFKKEFRIFLDNEPLRQLTNFRNDDDTNKIQVYRLENAPKSYKDFKNAFLFESNGLSFFDTIDPNKDYYYVLRSKDVHDNFSNPSYVLKVRIVEIEDVRYVESDIYADYENANSNTEFKPWVIYDKKVLENKKTISNLSFKRYLQISPSATQLLVKNLAPEKLIGNSVDNNLDAEIFGADAASAQLTTINSIKDKNYKLRIKSKNSGKILDLNFKFVVKK